MAFKIAISNHKGGVGKTTSAVNIGAGLALMKKKTLIIDLDPQANLSQCLNIDNAEKTIYGSIRGDYDLHAYEIKDNLFVVPSCLDLAGIELEIAAKVARELILSKLIKKIDNQFDYIIIDCPPSLGLIIVNAFAAVDTIFIPLQAQFLALHGLDKLMEVINIVKENINSDLTIGGVFVTQFDKRKVLNRDIKESVQEYFKDKVFKTIINDNVSLAEAPASGQDIFEYASNSKGAEDYKSLVKEIIKKFK
jgi:chromosome partitioning protein